MRVLASALACSLAAAAAPPDPQHTVAIASVEARGGATAEDAAAVNDALASQLVNDGRLRLVERQQMAKVMKEQALAQTGAMSDEVQVKLAQLVGARFIAVGAVQGSGRSLSLSLRAIDSSSGQVVSAETLKIGGPDQLDAGGRQLARKLEDKLVGASQGTAAVSNDAVGDFDVGQVKDGARALARSLAMRFPRISGKLTDTLPDGTATCSFGKAQPFVGQFFEVSGHDDVTESERKKGFFLLRSFSSGGCGGRLKRDGPGEISGGDTLSSVPLKLAFQTLEAGAGAQPELAKLLSDEARGALQVAPQFTLSEQPQLTAQGRVTGPRGHRVVELQVVDKSGNVVQQLELPGSY
jgi:TolB-like protein